MSRLAAIVLLIGCGSSHGRTDDAGIEMLADAGRDAGPPDAGAGVCSIPCTDTGSTYWGANRYYMSLHIGDVDYAWLCGGHHSATRLWEVRNSAWAAAHDNANHGAPSHGIDGLIVSAAAARQRPLPSRSRIQKR